MGITGQAMSGQSQGAPKSKAALLHSVHSPSCEKENEITVRGKWSSTLYSSAFHQPIHRPRLVADSRTSGISTSSILQQHADVRGASEGSLTVPNDRIHVNGATGTSLTAARQYAQSQRVRWRLKRVAQKHCSPTDLHVQFIPESDLARLVGPEQVILELSRTHPEKIREFVERGVCDHHLPLESRGLTEKSNGQSGLSSKKSPDVSWGLFDGTDDENEFTKLQWSVIPHKFYKADDSHLPQDKLESNEILPFKYHRQVTWKGINEVFKTKIHPDYHPWNKSKEQKSKKHCDVFAVKVLTLEHDSGLPQEIKILEKLRKSTHYHPHLVELLATYEQNKKYHLIFPWAKSDLFIYWKQNPNPDKNTEMGLWLIKQCHGLAEALNRIHHYETYSTSLLPDYAVPPLYTQNYISDKDQHNPHLIKQIFGRHGDLKPNNILWYYDAKCKFGILKICDFGSTQFRANGKNYGRVPNSPTYRSPEYGLKKPYGIACDVWALGCVYLLFTTWFFGGFKAVEQFGHKRLEPDETWEGIICDTFFAILEKDGSQEAIVKPVVVKKIDELKCLLHASKYISIKAQFITLLELIKNDMLVVNHDHQSGQVTTQESKIAIKLQQSLSIPDQPTRRKSCGKILNRLGDHCPGDSEVTRQSTMNI